jgi:hypothetical protein
MLIGEQENCGNQAKAKDANSDCQPPMGLLSGADQHGILSGIAIEYANCCSEYSARLIESVAAPLLEK